MSQVSYNQLLCSLHSFTFWEWQDRRPDEPFLIAEVFDMRTRNLAWSLTVMLSAALTYAESPASPDARTVAAARQAWAITDLVLQRDIDPPARQQMLLSGLKALLRQTPGRKVTDLGTRVSAVTTPEQFAALLAEAWPTGDAAKKADEESPEHTLFHGLFGGEKSHEHVAGGHGYLSPDELKRYEVLTGNRYVGTGIQIRMDQKEKLAQIVVPFPGGPARKAGARHGDLIVEVNDQSMAGKSLREYVQRLQGEDGTEVSMTVRQPGESKTRRLPMVRGVVPFTSVHGYRRTGEESWSFQIDAEAGVGYLSLSELKSSTLLELRKIESLVREQGVIALVLDLRFTHGTELPYATLVADGLLDGGVLWRVRDAHDKVKEYKADRDCLFRDMPMAVLIDKHTGQKADIVAAALQDRKRAVLVGEPTARNLTVSSLVPLPEGQGALILRTGTVERTARGDKPDAADGVVVPDHRVSLERKQMEAVLEWQAQQESPEPRADAKPPADPQLDKAVALLREALAKQNKKAAQ
jgi:carboxyl-terminal processing protease